MPRPKRDYGEAIRIDITLLEKKISTLVFQRDQLQAMLSARESIRPSGVTALRPSTGPATKLPLRKQQRA